MPQKTIQLDVKGRKMIMFGPPVPKRTTNAGVRMFWRFVVDEREYRRDKSGMERHEIFLDADRTTTDIIYNLRQHLYHWISSSWLDSMSGNEGRGWAVQAEPKVIAFINKYRE